MRSLSRFTGQPRLDNDGRRPTCRARRSRSSTAGWRAGVEIRQEPQVPAAGEFYGVGSVAVDSKGNVYAGETYEGKRVQKFVRKW